jgi:TIR domain
MPGIFISYRRSQTSAYAGRLYDRLSAVFGRDRVFIDLSGIDPGADFVERIEDAVGDADALLVVIGPDWATVSDEHGRLRLDRPDDFVRREVLGAHERDTLIVPVLVQGATMPPEERLPDALRFLTRRHAIALTDNGWARDVDGLVDTLRRRLPRRGRSRHAITAVRAAIALGLVAAGTAAAVALPMGGDDSDRGGLELAGEVAVGGYPVYASAVDGKVWVAQQGEDRLKIVADPGRPVSDSASLGTDLSGLAAADGRLWVGAYGNDDADGRGTVVDVDPATGRPAGKPIRTTDPFEIATDGTSLWVADLDGVLQRVDVASRKVTSRTRVDGGVFDVAVLDGIAWAVVVESGELVPFDARTAQPRGRPIEVGARPLSVAVARGMLWVSTEQGQLVRVAPESGARRSLAVGGEGRRFVEANADGVWLIDGQGYVVLVDPDRFAVVSRLRLPGGDLQDITLDRGGAWVLRSRSSEPSTVARIVRAAEG